MASASQDGAPSSELRADYTSPTSSKSFNHALPSASGSTSSTKEKTAYLAILRKSVVQLQGDINEFLTTKMEEDKALAAKAGLKSDDKKEEENYGEEGVDEGD
ncbi:EKC/KEOPS complex subunit GON7, partial [Lecanoromycetidae sp. Uapishka_2]